MPFQFEATRLDERDVRVSSCSGINHEREAMTEQEITYSILIYEDASGTWVKVPEFDFQLLAENLEAVLPLLEERLAFEVGKRMKPGEKLPARRCRMVRRVSKTEFGLTQAE